MISKLRPFFNHPEFIGAMVEEARGALARIPAERLGSTQVLYTAPSIPLSMAGWCDYEAQLREVGTLNDE